MTLGAARYRCRKLGVLLRWDAYTSRPGAQRWRLIDGKAERWVPIDPVADGVVLPPDPLTLPEIEEWLGETVTS